MVAKIVELIETYERRGQGTKEDPVRTVWQLWTKEGRLVCEDDFIVGYYYINGKYIEEKKDEEN